MFMSFRDDPGIIRDYYIKSDNVVCNTYVAGRVNYVDPSDPAKHQNCLDFSFSNVTFIYCVLF